tara:strand:- start:245 stop:634 length:390 start_codon:yes stop_codon:yes gene_type:complete
MVMGGNSFIASINTCGYNRYIKMHDNKRTVDSIMDKLLPLTQCRTSARYQVSSLKAKQNKLSKLETYEEYMRRKKKLNIQNQQFVKDNKIKNVEIYANYMKKRRAKYKKKFGRSTNNNSKYNRTKEYDN